MTSIIVIFVLGAIVSATPSAIIANLVLLLSEGGASKSMAFFLGWEIVLIVMTFIGMGVAWFALGRFHIPEDSKATVYVGYAEIAIGVVMVIGAAITLWRGRAQLDAAMDKAVQTVDKVSPTMSFGIGGASASLNLPWALAAAATVLTLQHNDVAALSLLVLFVLLGSVTIGLPAILPLIAPSKAGAVLTHVRDYVQRNGAYIAGGATAAVALVILWNGLKAVGWV